MESILYIGGFELPDNNAAAQRVVANAKILREIGYEVSLIGLGKQSEEMEYEGFLCRNLKYPASPQEWYGYLFSIKHLLPMIKKNSPSLILAYNYPAWALEKLRILCKGKNIKLVADCTEWYTPEGNIIFRLIKGWDTSMRMKSVQPKLDGVISISRFLHEYYSSRGTMSLQLPPLVDIEEEKWGKSYDLKQEVYRALRLVYAGSPGHKDRLDFIVRAIVEQNYNKNISFTVIGLDESQFRALYEYKDEIPDNIQFKGRIPHKEVMDALLAADFQIFVREDNITTRAGFPTKFVESISAGLPVITNLTSNLDDYLSDGKFGYVLDATTEKTLKKSLIKVLKRSDEEYLAVKQSIDRKTFDYRRYIERVKDFLGSI